MDFIEAPQTPEKGSLVGEYYSPSFIASWKECPAKTMLNYLSPRTQNNIYTSSGSAVHMFLEWFFTEFEEDIKQASKGTPNALTSYKVNVTRYGNKLTEFVNECIENEKLTEDNIPKMRARVNDFVKDGLALTIPTNISKIETEQEIIKPVTACGTTLPALKGIVDRADYLEDGKAYITDYKTSTKQLSLENMAKFRRQTLVYNWLINDGNPVSNVNIEYITNNGTHMYKLLPPTEEEQTSLVNDIVEVDTQVCECLKTGKYPKKDNWQCCGDFFCPFKGVCRS